MALPYSQPVAAGVPMSLGAGVRLPPLAAPPPNGGSAPLISDGMVRRLRDALKACYDELKPFREQYAERLRLYTGGGYGANEEEVDTPFNCYNLAMRVYQRQLISGDPRVLVRSKSPYSRTEAYELSLAVNDALREMDLQSAIKEVVLQALLSAGIVKLGITPSWFAGSLGFRHEAEQVYCDPVLLEDFAFDTGAKRWEEIDWCGNKYSVPLDDVLSSDAFDASAVREVGYGGRKRSEELKERRNEYESVKQLGTEDSIIQESARQYIELWDVWLPRERLLVTMLEKGGRPLRVQRWRGRKTGPYRLLCLDPVPGNVLPTSPGAHLENLANLLNRAIRKLGNQLDRQKTNPVISPMAASDGLAQAYQDALDGEILTSQYPKEIGEIRSSGVDQQSYAFTLGIRDLFSWLGGNIDTLGGLSSQAGTLGQEQMLAKESSSLIADLNTKVMQFLKGVVTDIAWYLYTDPSGSRKLTKRLEGTDWEIPVRWTAARRQRPFSHFDFEVDPYSIHVRSPGERLQAIFQILPLSMQMAQIAAVLGQVGGKFDVESAWRLITRYKGLEEFSELLSFSGEPVTAAPRGPENLPKPNTPREYVRWSASAGGQQMGPGQQALAQMMSAGANQQKPQSATPAE